MVWPWKLPWLTAGGRANKAERVSAGIWNWIPMGDAIHRWVHDTALQVAPRAARAGADGANRSSREMDINVAARKDIPKTETEIRIEKHARKSRNRGPRVA